MVSPTTAASCGKEWDGFHEFVYLPFFLTLLLSALCLNSHPFLCPFHSRSSFCPLTLPPQLQRKNVDSYQPNQPIPCCQLQLQWTKTEVLHAKVSHNVNLIGAAPPETCIEIMFQGESSAMWFVQTLLSWWLIKLLIASVSLATCLIV